MAKSGAKGSDRYDSAIGPSQIKLPQTGNWRRRTPSKARFAATRKSSRPSRAVKRER